MVQIRDGGDSIALHETIHLTIPLAQIARNKLHVATTTYDSRFHLRLCFMLGSEHSAVIRCTPGSFPRDFYRIVVAQRSRCFELDIQPALTSIGDFLDDHSHWID